MRRLFTAACLALFLSMPAGRARAGLDGEVETIVGVDAAPGGIGPYAEERVDVSYRDLTAGVDGVLGASLLLTGYGKGVDVYRMSLGRRVGTVATVEAGRMERADGRGFYLLDGLSVRTDGGRWFGLYGGVASSVESFVRTRDADPVVGLEGAAGYGRPRGSGRAGMEGRVGCEFFEQQGWRQRFLWSAALWARGRLVETSGGYADGAVETATVNMEEHVSGDLLMAVEYSYDRPLFFGFNGAGVPLRHRLAAALSPGREETLGLYGEHRGAAARSYGRLRYVMKEAGGDGAAVSGGLRIGLSGDVELHVSAEYMRRASESSAALIGASRLHVTARTVLELTAGLFRRYRLLEGEDVVAGVEAELQRMMGGGVFLRAAAAAVFNVDSVDEYRVWAGVARRVSLY
ncbi:MAG TPA: hypothetical protein ENJ37_09270 [Deltaproteobacteria bacterium]|nr:hypothetical protein [Deltaproteobacteria bacterium]